MKTHPVFIGLPLAPAGRLFKDYTITESGRVWSPLSRTYLKPIAGRVRLVGQWHTVIHLVAELYCSRPMGATRVRRRKGVSNHYSNLRWIKPRPKSTHRPTYLIDGVEYKSLKLIAVKYEVSRMTVHRWMKEGKITRQPLSP